jgi:hypothetical protein
MGAGAQGYQTPRCAPERRNRVLRKDSQMSEISALEGRITAALDRIRAGIAAQHTAVPQTVAPDTAGDLDTLRSQLDEERRANAQLEDRVGAVKLRQEKTVSELEARAASQAGQLTVLSDEIQRLRASNVDLRDLNAQLRSAAADGATSPDLINRATLAEVDALQTQRRSEAAEMDVIVSQLKPLIEDA